MEGGPLNGWRLTWAISDDPDRTGLLLEVIRNDTVVNVSNLVPVPFDTWVTVELAVTPLGPTRSAIAITVHTAEGARAARSWWSKTPTSPRRQTAALRASIESAPWLDNLLIRPPARHPGGHPLRREAPMPAPEIVLRPLAAFPAEAFPRLAGGYTSPARWAVRREVTPDAITITTTLEPLATPYLKHWAYTEDDLRGYADLVAAEGLSWGAYAGGGPGRDRPG